MRIASKPGFLTLKSEPTSAKPTVSISASLTTVIRQWTSGTRVSPLWSLNAPKPFLPNFSGTNILLFLGPVSPARLFSEIDLSHNPSNLQAWVGLGTFNLILRIDGDLVGRAAERQISKWASTRGIPIEAWDIDDGSLKRFRAHPLASPEDRSIFARLSKLASVSFNDGINIHAQEFFVLAASALSRSASVSPKLRADLEHVAEKMLLNVEDAKSDSSEILDLSAQLISVNAALSRFSSQAFSGISPIVSTECHFWIHSLLGTGSANIALSKLVEFIALRLGNARFPERFIALKEVKIGTPTWEQIATDDSFLWRDHIGNVKLSAEELKQTIQPIVTYFSGRDGYSSQLQTLSAPLTSLAQANSFQTNILTVTHEISHVFIEGVLGYLYPDVDDVSEIQGLTEFVVSEREPANMFEAARKLLTEAVITIQDLHQGGNKVHNNRLTPNQMQDILTRWRKEAKEILVHTFDYLYFFQDDADRYVESIWSTWCAIPGISERIPEYIMRTLCAISPKLLKLNPKDRRERARLVVVDALTRLAKDDSLTTDYVITALRYLEDNWTTGVGGNPSISKMYDVWLYLVRLTTAFLYSDDVAATLFSERHVVKHGSGGYAKKSCYYDDFPIENPIRFIRDHLSKSPREPESVWLLHNVAFCLTGDT